MKGKFIIKDDKEITRDEFVNVFKIKEIQIYKCSNKSFSF